MRTRAEDRAVRLAVAAVVAGVLVRLVLAFERPLWADEVFTLFLARQPLRELLARLTIDSGPPLHYLLAKAVLIPFPRPGAWDVVVRLLSVVASVLHLPLLLRLGRTRTGLAGWPAAALYSLFPIAVYFGAEGRGYALASLLVLAAFSFALDIADKPAPVTHVVRLGFVMAAAFLTHYLALFPMAGFLYLLVDARRENRRRLLAAFALAAALASPWLLVAASQPKASMHWVAPESFLLSLTRFFVNVVLGAETSRSPLVPLASAAMIVAILLARAGWRGRSQAGAVLVTGSLLLVSAAPLLPPVLLPERSAVLFLPFAALLIAFAGDAATLGVAVGAAALLVPAVSDWCVNTPSQELAMRLLPAARRGDTIAAAALWGPELRYRMARAHAPGRVVLFPSDVEAHPGWYAEDEIPGERLSREAAALLAGPDRPRFLVLPAGLRATNALRRALVDERIRLVARTSLFDVVEVPPKR